MSDEPERIFDRSATKQSIHINCGNFDGTHNALRGASVGASELGTFAGLSYYEDPDSAWKYKIGLLKKDFSEACEHGHHCEPESKRMVSNLIRTTHPHISQTFEIEPGYDKPKLGENEIFTDEIDCEHNGCSIDARGPIIDCEIKNPTSYFSWDFNYNRRILPTVFAQVQHTMAIRGRTSMLLYCTSFAKNDTSILLGEVLWEITFAKEWYMEVLKKPGRVVAEALAKYLPKGLDDFDVPTSLEGLASLSSSYSKEKAKEYAGSDEWKEIINTYCKKVYCKVNTEAKNRYLEEQKKSQYQQKRSYNNTTATTIVKKQRKTTPLPTAATLYGYLTRPT